jgi:hypothetical protein
MNPTIEVIKLDLALRLRKQELVCIPTDGNKKALYPWKDYKTNLPSEEKYAEWFSEERTGEGIAVLAGKVQCLDIDTKHDSGIRDRLFDELRDAGFDELLDRLVCQTTVSGGQHLIWQTAEANPPGNQKLASNKSREVTLETRGAGGYFLIAPSNGYELEHGDWENIPVISQDEQDALFRIARGLDQGKKPDDFEPTFKPDSIPQSGKTPGDDFDERGDLSELLKEHGWNPFGGGKYWTRPGKEKGISATLGYIEGRFWVWSTSTQFEAEKVYRPWHIYAILEHGGDWSAAAGELRRQGYGDSMPSSGDFEDDCPVMSVDEKLPFPEDLPSPIKEIAGEAVRLYRVEKDLPVLMALANLSAALGRSFFLDAPPHKTPGVIQALNIGPSGGGKSNCYGLISKPFIDADLARLNNWMEKNLPGIQAKIKMLEQKEKKAITDAFKNGEPEDQREQALTGIIRDLDKQKRKLHPIRLIVEDVTIPKLGGLLEANDSTMAVFSSEAGDVLSNIYGRNSSVGRTEEHIYKKGFSLESGRVDRVSTGTFVLKEICIAICWVTTPDELSSLFKSELFVHGGFLPRFLICESKSLPKLDDGIDRREDSGVVEEWGQAINELLELRDQYKEDRVMIQPTDAAMNTFRSYGNYYAKKARTNSKSGSFDARRRENAQRLALILHVGQFRKDAVNKELSEATALLACKLSTYYSRTYNRTIERAAKGTDLADLERIEKTANEHGKPTEEGLEITVRNLKLRNGLSEARLKALAETFGDQFKIVTKKAGPNGGRRSKVVILSSKAGL